MFHLKNLIKLHFTPGKIYGTVKEYFNNNRYIKIVDIHDETGRPSECEAYFVVRKTIAKLNLQPGQKVSFIANTQLFPYWEYDYSIDEVFESGEEIIIPDEYLIHFSYPRQWEIIDTYPWEGDVDKMYEALFAGTNL